MKLNRRHLRKMILNEIRKINESRGYIKQQMPDGRIALYQHVDGSGGFGSTRFVKFEGDLDPEDYETVDGECPQTGRPFKMEVDVRQQYGREVAYQNYYHPALQDRIDRACAIYPRTYTLRMAKREKDSGLISY
mgnify:CR=1 FL=1